MPRPTPTWVYHFTRIEHLRTIVEAGLLCDRLAQSAGLLAIEVGNTGIKARRAARRVPVEPQGVVADYVPFYFAPRSPMLYSIHKGNVPGYAGGADRIVYLATTVERMLELGLDLVLTDRNAVLAVADFVRLRDGEPPDQFIDWPLMEERLWFDNEDYPDRRERRMAECLVHRSVPWEALLLVGARRQTVADEALRIVSSAGSEPSVAVRPNWYF